MIAFDPIAHVQLTPRDRQWKLYHGAGASYNFLFGNNFSSFNKLALKIRPAAFEYRATRFTWGVAYNMRFYADEFRAEDFGIGPTPHRIPDSNWKPPMTPKTGPTSSCKAFPSSYAFSPRAAPGNRFRLS